MTRRALFGLVAGAWAAGFAPTKPPYERCVAQRAITGIDGGAGTAYSCVIDEIHVHETRAVLDAIDAIEAHGRSLKRYRRIRL